MKEPANWNDVFLEMCDTIAKKSKDGSTTCGAVLVDKSNQIISCGFNGPPSQIQDELVPWDKRPDKYAYIMHAEENALWTGMNVDINRVIGSTMYVNTMPCYNCILRMIKNGVEKVVYGSGEKAIVCDEENFNVIQNMIAILKPGVKFFIQQYKK
jgi:dCMP deaminase